MVRVLWLEGVFDEACLSAFPTCSPAVNYWHDGFVSALIRNNVDLEIIGHVYDRYWPNGRLKIQKNSASLRQGLDGQLIGYINLPVIRKVSQSLNYFILVKRFVQVVGVPDFVFTFNDTPGTFAARYLSKRFKTNWIYIAGDGPVIKGANGYLYQNWNYFRSSDAPGPKIHLDGGLNHIHLSKNPNRGKNILMYMGALTEHGGVSQLARAFHKIENSNAELRIVGRGENQELESLASKDTRIKLYGFVSEAELHKLASEATLFANPRPTSFEPNKLNYPSKLLHYFSYGRPVMSTFTEGLSPEYRKVLIPILDETDEGMVQALSTTLSMPRDVYDAYCKKVQKFRLSKDWNCQVRRLLIWLENEF